MIDLTVIAAILATAAVFCAAFAVLAVMAGANGDRVLREAEEDRRIGELKAYMRGHEAGRRGAWQQAMAVEHGQGWVVPEWAMHGEEAE